MENYPPQCLRLLMNHIGTHDTERALTVLGGEPRREPGPGVAGGPAPYPEQRDTGSSGCGWPPSSNTCCPVCPACIMGTRLAWRVIGTPFCRGAFTPGGREGKNLLQWYKGLGMLRAQEKAILGKGSYRTLYADGNLLAFLRGSVFTEDARQSLDPGGQPQQPSPEHFKGWP